MLAEVDEDTESVDEDAADATMGDDESSNDDNDDSTTNQEIEHVTGGMQYDGMLG